MAGRRPATFTTPTSRRYFVALVWRCLRQSIKTIKCRSFVAGDLEPCPPPIDSDWRRTTADACSRLVSAPANQAANALCFGVRKRGCAGLVWLLWALFSFLVVWCERNEKEKARLVRDLGGRRVAIYGGGKFGIGKRATMAKIAFLPISLLASKKVGKRGFLELRIRNWWWSGW